MPTSLDLTGKVAVVTGAAQGIGAATADALADAGAALVLADQNTDRLDGVVKRLAGAGAAVTGVPLDVSDGEQVAALMARVDADHGRLDVLVNNAGITLAKRFTATTDDDWDRVMQVNLKSVFLTCQHAYPLLVTAGGGSIVNVASANGLVGRPMFSVYGSSKAGVIVLSRSLAVAWGDKNVRVNNVCPGSVDTPMLRSAFDRSGDPRREERLTSAVTPLGRIGRVEEVASLIHFLASDAASFITGQTVCVDGGRTAGIAESYHWQQEPFQE